MKIKECYELVKQTLIDKPYTRNDRNALVVEVLEQIEPGVTSLPFNVVVRRMTEDSPFPMLETIRRSAQKAQHNYPELQALDEVKKMRMFQEHKFFTFAIDRKI